MKLVIFTLDAIFALIIAVASIALLAFFFYSPQTTTVLSYSSAATTLQSLLGTSIANLAGANPLYYNLTYQSNASNEASDLYRNNIYQTASNPHGPLSPSISFIFNAGANPTNMSIDYGKVFFGAGNTLYAINATNGNLVWKKATGSTIYGKLAIAPGMLIYPNATNLTAVNPITNSLIWSSNGLNNVGYLSPYSSPLIVYNNKIYFGGTLSSAATDFGYYLNNGTNAWSLAAPSGGYSAAIDSGSLLIEHSGSVLKLLNDFGTSANVIWSQTLPSTLGFSVVPNGNIIALAGATQANAIYIDGTQAGGGFPYAAAGSASTFPAVYNNVAYYQSSNAITAVAANGLELWNAAIPAAAGSASGWDIVLASAKTVYSHWSNNYIVAINSSTGKISWSTKVPAQLGTIAAGDMALAYGRLYVVAGSNVIAFGSCNSESSGSVLAAAATMYANGDGSCADALVDDFAPMTNYSIFLNNTYAPGSNVINFDGATTNVQNPTKAPLNNLQTFTVTGWVYVNAYNPSQTDIYSEGTPSQTLILQISNAGALSMSSWNSNTVGNWQSYLTSLTVPIKKWTFVAYSLSVGGTKGTFIEYLNGQKQSGAGQPQQSAAVSSGIGYNVGNSVSQNAQYLNGMLANLQIYNSTLSTTQVSQIYQAGIQGAPLANAGLQAWYPLAGDTNDYSGFGNTAYPINALYVSSNYLPNGYQNSFQVSRAGVLLPIKNYTTGLSKLYGVSVVAWR